MSLSEKEIPHLRSCSGETYKEIFGDKLTKEVKP